MASSSPWCEQQLWLLLIRDLITGNSLLSFPGNSSITCTHLNISVINVGVQYPREPRWQRHEARCLPVRPDVHSQWPPTSKSMGRNLIRQRGPLLNKLKATVLYTWSCSRESVRPEATIIESFRIMAFSPAAVQQCAHWRRLLHTRTTAAFMNPKLEGCRSLFDRF